MKKAKFLTSMYYPKNTSTLLKPIRLQHLRAASEVLKIRGSVERLDIK